MSCFLLLGLPFLPWLGGTVAAFGGAFLIAVLFRLFAPESFDRIRGTLVQSPSLFWRGLVVLTLAIGLCVLLAMTVLGIPLAVVVGSVLSILAYVGLALACSVLGAALPLESLRERPVAQIAAGTTAAFLLAQVPLLGMVTTFGLSAWGMGALYQHLRTRQRPQLASA